MTFRPERGRGITIGVVATVWGLALGIGVLATASGGDITLGAFLLYAVGGALVVLGLVFAYWTYACATLAYGVDDAALRVRWGLHRVTVPLASVNIVSPAPSPERVQGVNWPGHHAGRTVLQGTAPAYVFAGEFIGGQAVYVRAGDLILALTPHDAAAFVADMERRRRGARPLAVPARSASFDPLSFLGDGAARGMAALAAVLVLVAFGVLFARYQDLPPALTVDYPAGRDAAHVVQRGDLFAIPLTGLVLLAINVVVGLLLHRRQRALAQTIMGGTLLLEVAVVAAAVAAVS